MYAANQHRCMRVKFQIIHIMFCLPHTFGQFPMSQQVRERERERVGEKEVLSCVRKPKALKSLTPKNVDPIVQ